MGSITRGALIVFEGGDRCGKTTQCGLLLKALVEEGIKAQLMKFPDRTTKIGKIINDYLLGNEDVEDHVVHLLYSANRWEAVPRMKDLLSRGTTLIVDRYAYSGVAFTAAKQDFDLEWCKMPDVGLPRPDVVVQLKLSTEAAMMRGGFGQERYEKADFQAKVANNYEKLKDSTWEVIDADKSIEDLHTELLTLCKRVIKSTENKPLSALWKKGIIKL
ncbi:hypothetical protein CHS0354_034966 [Potamilus streckersoni]|uniref:Thymidylate kinase n=1 Tax=Potamilus streckersoni TaxID=2493646 RepID=A0AAE0SDJ6_9BIVA|nr:hypothetical protein CHS0354_034966 [Potamilus streckersoni]